MLYPNGIIKKLRMKKIRVGIIFGGRSQEHEVSIRSAKNIYDALDKKKYDIVLFGIDKKGNWLQNIPHDTLLSQRSDMLLPHQTEKTMNPKTPDFLKGGVDVVFPVLHGPYGEDGTVQGLLKMLDVPFVGASVLGSAVGMDKDVSKRLLRDSGIPVAKFLTLKYKQHVVFENVVQQLGLPFFVKPANLGSSVGVARVKNEEEFHKAMANAYTYDNKILLEEEIRGRELEVSVLGNEELEVSVVGEVIPKGHEFYDYDAKYTDENGSVIQIPADIEKRQTEDIQEMAKKAARALCCEGMARVDFFLTDKGEVILNEINTIPGFTNISMYPKLWEASGVSYSELIDRLIQLSLDRHRRDSALL